jgi:endonuclease/exonuclease/phosphatase family metal-dependent hydrolase
MIVLFLLVLMGFRNVVPQKATQNLKVMTYNIWNGFDWGKDTLRKEEWINWIQDKNPDVLALQELCGYTEDKLRADAAKWGHRYVKILKTEGYPTGLTSREPITVKERVTEALWHGLLHCETYGIDFFVVHLSPADCDFRLKEADIIIDKIKDLKSDHYFILGDFNAHSPFDEEMQKNNQSLLEKYRKSTSDKYSNLRLGEFDYSVISKFISIPTIDVSLKFIDTADRYTFPSPVLIGSWRKDMQDVKQTRERIDYIFTSPSLAKSCTNVTIYNKGEAETFSDHYPLMAEFSFDSQK